MRKLRHEGYRTGPKIKQLLSSGDEVEQKWSDPNVELLTVISEEAWMMILFLCLWSLWFSVLASHYNHRRGIVKENFISGGQGPGMGAFDTHPL